MLKNVSSIFVGNSITIMELKQGRYTLQGIPVLDITQKYGTPVYVYDAEMIASRH